MRRRFALPTPIDQFASDYLNLKVSFQKLSSDGSIYGLTAYVDTEYQIEVDGSQRSIFLKTNDVVLDKSFIEPENIRKLCGIRRFTLAHECAHQILFQLYCSYSVFGNLYEIFKIARYAIRKIKERT